MPPPSVIKFLKEQEIKQEQLRQQLAKQEARRGQEAKEIEAKEIEAKEIADYLFSIYGSNVSFMLSNNEAAANPYLERAIFKGHHERSEARQQAFRNSKKAAAEAEAMAEEAAKEAERQRIRERNEKEKRDKEEEIARLRISLRPRVEEDVAKITWAGIASIVGGVGSQLTGNKVYDELFSELIQPRIEQFAKEKSRKGVEEAYEYIRRRQKDGIKHLGQWTGSELTPIEEEILERLKTAINNGFQSDIVKEIFNEYLKASNHSGGRRKTRRARKHSCRSMRRKH